MKRVISILLILLLMLVGCESKNGSKDSNLSGTYIEESGSGRTLVFNGKDNVELNGNWGTYAISGNAITFIFSGNVQTYSFSKVSDSLVIDGVAYTKEGKATYSDVLQTDRENNSTDAVSSTDNELGNSTTYEQSELTRNFVFEELVSEIPNSPIYYRNKMGCVEYNDKYGYLDENGKIVIEPKYYGAGSFNGEYALVKNSDNKVLIIDRLGNETSLSEEYSWGNFSRSISGVINNFANEIAIVHIPLGFAAINTMGEEIFRAENFEFCIRVAKNHYLFYNLENNNTEAVIYDSFGNKISDIAFMLENLSYNNYQVGFEYLINSEENLILASQFRDSEYLYGFIDVNGNVVININYEEFAMPAEGLIGFKKYGKWGFIDYTGNVIIEPAYEAVCSFYNGLCFVMDGGFVNVINKNGEVVIRTEYEALNNDASSASKFNNDGIALAGGGERTEVEFIDVSGKIVEFNALSSVNMYCFFDFDLNGSNFSFRDPSSQTWHVYKLASQ